MIEQIDQLNNTKLLLEVNADCKPHWGKMSFQHMIEHLSETIKISNGTAPLKKPDVPDHIFDQLKKFLMGKNEFPKGFISPLIGEELPTLRHLNTEKALDELQHEIRIYAQFWKTNPTETFFNPTFGMLKQDQWQKFHDKHFTHHFKQFGILW